MDVVKDYGEVLTPPHIVNEMLDMIDEGISLTDKVLEPACGDGNFLVEILRRKLDKAETPDDILVAYATIWGIDIQPRNVMLARNRMYEMLPDDVLSDRVQDILVHNIIVGDSLSEKMIRMDWSCRNKDIQLVKDGQDFDVAKIIAHGGDIVEEMDIRELDPSTMEFIYEPKVETTDRKAMFLSFLNSVGKK